MTPKNKTILILDFQVSKIAIVRLKNKTKQNSLDYTENDCHRILHSEKN